MRPIFILFCGLNDIGYFCNICFWGPPFLPHFIRNSAAILYEPRLLGDGWCAIVLPRRPWCGVGTAFHRVCSDVALDKFQACHAWQRQKVNFLWFWEQGSPCWPFPSSGVHFMARYRLYLRNSNKILNLLPMATTLRIFEHQHRQN